MYKYVTKKASQIVVDYPKFVHEMMTTKGCVESVSNVSRRLRVFADRTNIAYSDLYEDNCIIIGHSSVAKQYGVKKLKPCEFAGLKNIKRVK